MKGVTGFLCVETGSLDKVIHTKYRLDIMIFAQYAKKNVGHYPQNINFTSKSATVEKGLKEENDWRNEATSN